MTNLTPTSAPKLRPNYYHPSFLGHFPREIAHTILYYLSPLDIIALRGINQSTLGFASAFLINNEQMYPDKANEQSSKENISTFLCEANKISAAFNHYRPIGRRLYLGPLEKSTLFNAYIFPIHQSSKNSSIYFLLLLRNLSVAYTHITEVGTDPQGWRYSINDKHVAAIDALEKMIIDQIKTAESTKKVTIEEKAIYGLLKKDLSNHLDEAEKKAAITKKSMLQLMPDFDQTISFSLNQEMFHIVLETSYGALSNEWLNFLSAVNLINRLIKNTDALLLKQPLLLLLSTLQSQMPLRYMIIRKNPSVFKKLLEKNIIDSNKLLMLHPGFLAFNLKNHNLCLLMIKAFGAENITGNKSLLLLDFLLSAIQKNRSNNFNQTKKTQATINSLTRFFSAVVQIDFDLPQQKMLAFFIEESRINESAYMSFFVPLILLFIQNKMDHLNLLKHFIINLASDSFIKKDMVQYDDIPFFCQASANQLIKNSQTSYYFSLPDNIRQQINQSILKFPEDGGIIVKAAIHMLIKRPPLKQYCGLVNEEIARQRNIRFFKNRRARNNNNLRSPGKENIPPPQKEKDAGSPTCRRSRF
jgi:hypothetical protein